MTGVLFPAQREKMEIQLMPWHSMTEPPILAWSYPATRSELLNLSRKKKHKARCKIRASSLCLSGTIAWANWRGLQTCLSDQRRNRAILYQCDLLYRKKGEGDGLAWTEGSRQAD